MAVNRENIVLSHDNDAGRKPALILGRQPACCILSLFLVAVEQAREGKPVIRNANAWLKAAVEKNGVPLRTARGIEAQVTGGQGAKTGQGASPQADQPASAAKSEEDEIFRPYRAVPGAQRRAIDRLVEALDRLFQGRSMSKKPGRLKYGDHWSQIRKSRRTNNGKRQSRLWRATKASGIHCSR